MRIITEDNIELIIASIGRPADFEAQDGFEAQSSSDYSSNNDNDSNDQWTSVRPKRLYRDEQNKVLGGVCSGIANYFSIEPLLVRILWIFLIGVNILGYLIYDSHHLSKEKSYRTLNKFYIYYQKVAYYTD